MAASVCQRHALQPPTEKPSIGQLLVAFLEVFGTATFDTRRACISLSPAGPLLPLAPHHFNTPRVGSAGFWQPAPPVVILDPLRPDANVAMSCFGFRQVQLCFDDALHTILAAPLGGAQAAAGRGGESCGSGGGSGGSGGGGSSVLGSMFGAAHHRHVVTLSASVWCPAEHPRGAPLRIGTSGGGVSQSPEALGPDVLALAASPPLVASLSAAELAELTSLLGRATPLSILETQRVQRLMRQTAPGAAASLRTSPVVRRYPKPDPVDPPMESRGGGGGGGGKEQTVAASGAGSSAAGVGVGPAAEGDDPRSDDAALRRACIDRLEAASGAELRAIAAVLFPGHNGQGNCFD